MATKRAPFTIDKILWLSPFFKTFKLIKERGVKGLITQMYVVRIVNILYLNI